MSNQRTTVLDLPRELRDHVYSLYARMPKLMSLAEFGANYQMFMEPFMTINAQIAEELKTTMLADNIAYLNVEKSYYRDMDIYPAGTTNLTSLRALEAAANWRFVSLPPLKLRRHFRRILVTLYAPPHPKPEPAARIWSEQDWMRPLSMLKTSGFVNIKELSLDVEYHYPWDWDILSKGEYIKTKTEDLLELECMISWTCRRTQDLPNLAALTLDIVRDTIQQTATDPIKTTIRFVEVSSCAQSLRERCVERTVHHGADDCYSVNGEKLECNCVKLASIDVVDHEVYAPRRKNSFRARDRIGAVTVFGLS